jgi:hypothetical protein
MDLYKTSALLVALFLLQITAALGDDQRVREVSDTGKVVTVDQHQPTGERSNRHKQLRRSRWVYHQAFLKRPPSPGPWAPLAPGD